MRNKVRLPKGWRLLKTGEVIPSPYMYWVEPPDADWFLEADRQDLEVGQRYSPRKYVPMACKVKGKKSKESR